MSRFDFGNAHATARCHHATGREGVTQILIRILSTEQLPDALRHTIRN
jgi:hypothetical protein